MRTGERGQILPGLLVVLLAVLAVGMLMFQVGKAAVLRSDAQTAADAAALAGANEIKRQLMTQWATAGTTDINLIDQAIVRARMAEYAKKNGATLIPSSVVIQGVDVKAAVTTDDEVGEGAKEVGKEDAKGEARARARIELMPGLGVGGSIGPIPGGGRRLRAGPEDLRQGLEGDQGGHRLQRADLRRPGRARQVPPGAGLRRRRERRLRPRRQHDPGGYHYKCGNRGAVDVNFGGPGDLDPLEVKAVDPIIAPLRELGFRTIWRAAGHYNHLHIDVANSGPIGAGSGGADGGFTGPLEDVLMEVRLIDWDAPAAPFFGFGGVGGGYFTGPPDPKAARAIC